VKRVAPESEVHGATAKRHTAPITPLVQAVQFAGIIGVFIVIQVFSSGRGVSPLTIALVVGGIIVVLLLVWAITYLRWQRFKFWFDDDGDLRVSSGILQQQERRLHLSRLQSVEVMQPLLARIFGMAQVRVEVAGGGDSRITLAYLTQSDAHAFRAETLARAAGVNPEAGEAPEAVLVQVPAGTLFKSTLLSIASVIWLVSLAVVVLLAALGATVAVLVGVGIAIFGSLIGAFAQFTTYFNFTVAQSPDGLRTRSGLLGVQAHTIPPGRVASLEFYEPLLWRPFGWVGLRVNIAGVKADENGNSTAHILLPVATRQVAVDLVGRFFPGLAVDSFEFSPVPPQAKWRAPLQHSFLGLGADEVMMGTRRGWLTRRTTFTPHARVQSVRLTQGPWQRRLGLASVHADIVPGPVHVVGAHRAAEDAREFVLAEVERARSASLTDLTVRWGLHDAQSTDADDQHIEISPGTEGTEHLQVSEHVEDPGLTAGHELTGVGGDEIAEPVATDFPKGSENRN
jgi:putative membrane protein